MAASEQAIRRQVNIFRHKTRVFKAGNSKEPSERSTELNKYERCPKQCLQNEGSAVFLPP